MGIHQYKKQFASAKSRIAANEKITPKSKDLISECINDLLLKNLSYPRLNRYMDVLRSLGEYCQDDLDKITKSQLKGYVSTIQQNEKYSAWTKQTYKVIIRRFYAWLHGCKKVGEYPEIVSWIDICMKKSEMRLPADGDLLKQEDIEKLIRCADHPRDKAFIAMLWETGARIGEIGNLTISRITFDEHGATLNVLGKTGSRMVRVIWCISYLSNRN